MRYAENNRISHRQMYRQIVLTFLAPFLLCLFGRGRLLGISGIAGTFAAVGLLLLYVIFLIRLAPAYAELYRTAGGFWSRVFGVFFGSYVLLTAAYLLSVLEKVVPQSLITGVPGRLLSLLAAAVCSFGTHRGMQRRGRMAEVSGGLLLGGVLLMMLLCLGQSRLSYLGEMFSSTALEGREFLNCGYGVLCAFSGIGLLPFLLEFAEKQRSSWKPVMLGILTLGGILAGMQLLLPAVFGWERLKREEYPVLPLLAGADLPGNVLARFDVLWMGFLLYSLLFALGSLFHYGHQIMEKSGLGSGRWWMAGAAYLLSFWEPAGAAVGDYYEKYLACLFVPGLLLIQAFLLSGGKKRSGIRRKSRAAALGAVFFLLLLGGCSAVEPEKRMYPLALGADWEEGKYLLTYGMPDLSQATGQEKQEEGSDPSVLTFAGKELEDIGREYNLSQEKYLDMGHLQVIVLGESLEREGRWARLLDYLEKEPFVGENVYLFSAGDPREILEWKGGGNTSVGEYLTGLLENRISGQQRKGTTLRQAYHGYYEDGTLVELPRLEVSGERLRVAFPEEETAETPGNALF